MEGWNGISLISRMAPQRIPLVSGSWGCGAFWGPHWFQWQWEGRASDWTIAPKELLPIVCSLAIWGKHWSGSRVECRCDNAAVVAVVNSGKAKDSTLLHLLRCLFSWQPTIVSTSTPPTSRERTTWPQMHFHVTHSRLSCRWSQTPTRTRLPSRELCWI